MDQRHHHSCGHKHDHSHDHQHIHHDSEDHIKSQSNGAQDEQESIHSQFEVIGMDCADEVASIQAQLKKSGIFEVRANLMDSSVLVRHTADWSQSKIVREIERAGVKVKAKESESKITNLRYALVVGAGISCAFGFAFEWMKIGVIPHEIFHLFAVFLGGQLVVPKAYRALRNGHIEMNVLMSIAVIGAIILGEFEEASTVVFLFALAELLESLSVHRARRAVREILQVAPQKAKVRSAGSWVERDCASVSINEIVRVVAGERIPLDGIVVSGEGLVNQAPLTGESAPIEKSLGSEVYAGSLCENGVIEFRVTKVANDTRIAAVIRLIKDSQSTKAPSQRFVDRFARIYTPLVLIAAIMVFIIPVAFLGGEVQIWFYRALVLLVIACPCALVISTPIAIVSGLASLARHGVLIKGGEALEGLARAKIVAIDKTGTLTEGKPNVQKVIPWKENSIEKVLEIVAAIEFKSNHPLAKAIVQYVEGKNLVIEDAIRVLSMNGRGVEADVKGHRYFLGNHRFAHDLGVCSIELESLLDKLELDSHSVVVVGHVTHDSCSGDVIGVIALSDKIRSDASESLIELRKQNISKIVLLSGDNRKTSESIGRAVGVDEIYGDLLPDQKVLKLKEMARLDENVVMVGDGINDAPAMAAAKIGVAMGSGSELAVDAAQVILVKNDLKMLAVAIKHAKKTLQIIQFNIGFALITKLIFLLLSILGFSSMWLAVAADTGASLFVAANSMRLQRLSKR